jgi:hypothetical protein
VGVSKAPTHRTPVRRGLSDAGRRFTFRRHVACPARCSSVSPARCRPTCSASAAGAPTWECALDLGDVSADRYVRRMKAQ